MSKILKSTYINIDNQNVFSVNNDISEKLRNHNDLEIETKYDYEENISQIEDEILEAARVQAEKIIESAKLKAKEIVKNKENEMSIKSLEIFEKSKQSGYEEGKNKAIFEYEKLKTQAEDLLENTKIEREETIKRLEPEITELIIEITKKIMTDAFHFNSEIIGLLIKKGLNSVKTVENLNIYVSEEQYDFLEKNKNDILGFDTLKKNIEILKDTRLGNMDCIIETDFGTIKCGIDEQLEGIKEALYSIL